MTKYVIIGGDAAGMSAATQIKRLDPDAEVFAFEKGDTFSYAQCGLPYYLEGVVPSPDKLVARTEQQFREKNKIDARSYHEVIRIDPANKFVTVKNLAKGETFDQPYDKLLIATGAVPIVPPWPGVDEDGVFVLKTMADAKKIALYMEQQPVRKAVIIGAGYIGLEMSEALTARNLDVTVIEKTGQVGTALDADISEHVREYISSHINLKLNEEVREIKKTEHGLSVVTDQGSYPADLVLVAVGVKPNSELAAQAGVATGIRGAIRVNQKMETSVPDIYAAGDCAVQYHRLKQEDDYVPLGTHANKQGRVAGTNMAGGYARFAGVMGTAVFKVMDLQVARTGMGEREAEQARIDFDVVSVKSLQHAHYYPDAKPLYVKLLFTRDEQKVIGGQFVGYEGVDKQVDVLATAMYQELTLRQLQELDLAYAPPFSTVWSPIQQAAGVAVKKK